MPVIHISNMWSWTISIVTLTNRSRVCKTYSVVLNQPSSLSHCTRTQGRYLQQGHFNDQVNEIGQQFLKEILAVCFYTRGWGSYYETYMADPCWSKSVSVCSFELPSPTNPSLHPSLHPCFMPTVATEWHWWKWANYGVSAGFSKLNLRL